MIIIQPDGTKLVSQHDPKRRPSYKELQHHVGGLIQACGQFLEDGREAYCNEEFLLRGLAVNLEGSRLVRWPVGKKDFLSGETVAPLHGPVIILEGFADEEDDEEEEGEGEAEPSPPREPKVVGGALDVLLILHHEAKGTYHPAYFTEAPFPGPPQAVEQVKAVRLRSKMHHTKGAPTLEGAQALFDELAQDVLVPPENRWRDRVLEWDGTEGITIVVDNWRAAGTD